MGGKIEGEAGGVRTNQQLSDEDRLLRAIFGLDSFAEPIPLTPLQETKKIGEEPDMDTIDEESHNLLRQQVDEVLSGLKYRERLVLELRLGLKDGKSRTLQEIGDEWGITRARVHQIEAKALKKLRHPSSQ